MKWSELTEVQKNALVAEKVMGQQVQQCDGSNGHMERDGAYITCLDCGSSIHVSDGDWQHIQHGIIPLPAYSTDMNAAWQIVDTDRFNRVTLSRFRVGILMPKEHQYLCDILLDNETFSCSGTMAPEAICLTALKACGVDIEP